MPAPSNYQRPPAPPEPTPPGVCPAHPWLEYRLEALERRQMHTQRLILAAVLLNLILRLLLPG